MDIIKVLIVDDSLLFRETLSKGLNQLNDIQVIGSAVDPFDAKDKIIALRPDVVTLDVEMPRMNGIKFLKSLMPQFPIPVVVVSSLKESVFEAMDAGAVDFVAKPEDQSGNITSFIEATAEKIRIAKNAKFAYKKAIEPRIELSTDEVLGPINPLNVIAIGASTGGTDAINSILTKFSKNMPGIVIVQHMPQGFTKLYAERLNSSCELDVFEAKNGDELRPGTALIAPGDYQMRLIRNGNGYSVLVDQSQKVNGHRPSVDVLFESVAKSAGRDAIGVILTGMGADGALGLKMIRDVGGYTIGQDERSSVVYGMPMAAFVSGAVAIQLPLYRIPDELCRKLSATKSFI